MSIGRNNPCPCGSGKKYKKCCIGYQKAPMGTVQHLFDFGSQDPFAARIMFQIFQLRDFLYSNDNKQRDGFDKLYNTVLQNLIEAKSVKEKCIDLVREHTNEVTKGKIARFNGKNIEVDKSIETDLNIWFKDFFIRGNMASKGLIALGKFLEYKLAFAFNANEKKYNKGKEEFLELHQKDNHKLFIKIMEGHRKNWYKSFTGIRHKIEHEGYTVPKITYIHSDEKIKPVIPRFNSMTIEDFLNLLWKNLFYLCEDITVLLISFKLPKPFAIMQIPKKDREPNMPIKYKIVPAIPTKTAKTNPKKNIKKK